MLRQNLLPSRMSDSNWPARQYALFLRVFNAKPLFLTENKAITIPEQQRKTHHSLERHTLTL